MNDSTKEQPELEEMIDGSEEDSPKLYYFPKSKERWYFPLLFPRSESDRQSILRIAEAWEIDYDALFIQLKICEKPIRDKKLSRSRFGEFKKTYKSLREAVLSEEERYGITLTEYGITKPGTKIQTTE